MLRTSRDTLKLGILKLGVLNVGIMNFGCFATGLFGVWATLAELNFGLFETG
jgi:hypothetical protein